MLSIPIWPTYTMDYVFHTVTLFPRLLTLIKGVFVIVSDCPSLYPCIPCSISPRSAFISWYFLSTMTSNLNYSSNINLETDILIPPPNIYPRHFALMSMPNILTWIFVTWNIWALRLIYFRLPSICSVYHQKLGIWWDRCRVFFLRKHKNIWTAQTMIIYNDKTSNLRGD